MDFKEDLLYLKDTRIPPLIGEAFFLLNICGVNPLKQNVYYKFLSFSILISACFVDIEILLGLIYHWKGVDSMFDITIFFGIYQVIVILLSFMIYRLRFVELLRILKHFWHFDAAEMKDTNRITKRISKWIVAVFLFVTMTFSIIPFWFRTLLFNTYHPLDTSVSPDFEIMYFIQCYGAAVAVTGFYGCEAMFIFFIMSIIGEFRIIKERFQALPTEYKKTNDKQKFLKNLRIIIEQHVLVLRFVAEVNDVYSFIILTHVLTSILCISTNLVTVLIRGFSDVINLFRLTAYGVGYLILFFTYCLFGTALTTSGLSIADGILEAEWSDVNSKAFRSAYIMITQRSQKEEMITAGRMFYLNLKTFTSIINSSLSFIALFQAIYK